MTIRPRIVHNERQRGVTWDGSSDDPFFWCGACADDVHAEHSGCYVDVFGETHACCCTRCAA